MDEAGKRTAAETKATSIISLLSSDNITDILLRLPAKSVLCAGAVCKAWRRITTITTFLAEHARLQPTNVVLYTYLYSPGCKEIRPGYFEDELALDLLPISSDDDDEAESVRCRRRRLIRYPIEATFLVLASFKGVLLFQKSWGTYLLCNPTTSQWAVLSTGGGDTEPREVDLPAWLPETMGITNLLRTTPVALQGRLHWPPHRASTSTSTSTTKMVVFDMTSETFHVMAGPPTATANQTKVFDMEGRGLVAADFGGEEHVDLWFLEDYDSAAGTGRWERRHRAPTPWHTGGTQMPGTAERRPKFVAAAGDDREGGVVMLGNHLGMLVYSLRTRTARTVESVAASEDKVVVSRHVFRESLEKHPSFATRSAAELGVNISWH